jgi:hypothetical protein
MAGLFSAMPAASWPNACATFAPAEKRTALARRMRLRRPPLICRSRGDDLPRRARARRGLIILSFEFKIPNSEFEMSLPTNCFLSCWSVGVNPKRVNSQKLGFFQSSLALCRCLLAALTLLTSAPTRFIEEIKSFFKRSHNVIVALTVQEILDEHIAKKLVQRRAYGSKYPATGRTLQAPAVWHFVEIIQITFQRRAAVGHRLTLHDSAPTKPDRA